MIKELTFLALVAGFFTWLATRWKYMSKGARTERRHAAEKKKHQARVQKSQAEMELEAQKARAVAAADRVEEKRREAEEEKARARDIPDDAVGGALRDELKRD